MNAKTSEGYKNILTLLILMPSHTLIVSLENRLYKEEMKMVDETKILGDDTIR